MTFPDLVSTLKSQAPQLRGRLLPNQALAELMRGRTVLVIAHRLATVRNADRIVVVHEGRLAEVGRHDELLARDGLYRRLYALQMEGVAG